MFVKYQEVKKKYSGNRKTKHDVASQPNSIQMIKQTRGRYKNTKGIFLYNIDINVNVATYNETLGSFPVVFNVTGKYQDEMNYNNIVYATVNKSGLNNVQLAVELPKSTVLTIEEIYTGNSISVVEGETLSEFELIDDGEVYTCYFENDYNGSAKVASHVNNIFSPNELEEVWNWEKNYD